jgi:predicted DNA-binding ArsR family transcriptional regulator
LAHSDAAATYKADVSALALEATLTAIKGAGWTTETLKAIADAVDSLNDPTPQQVWEYATRTLTDPDSYKADVSGLALEATLTAMKGAGWTDETLVSLMTAIESGTVDEATIRSAVGLASANLDTQLSGIQTDLDNPSQYKADVSGLAPAGEYDTELDATISSRAPADEYDTELTNLQADITTILTDYARRTGDYAPADEYDTELTNLAADITTIVTDYARRTGDYAPASEYDTELTAIQADLDNPDQYKADISALALEATLTAIKGSGWTDETLKAIKDAIDGISVDGASAEEVWEYVSRTLTQSATEVTAAVSGSSITQIRGNSWSIEITGVTLDSNKQQFMLKKSSGSSDDNAVLFIDSETGLLTVNGVTATDATKASLSYVGTTLTVTVDASITAQLPAETLDYGIQSVTAAGAVSELYSGDFVITADIVRATE